MISDQKIQVNIQHWVKNLIEKKLLKIVQLTEQLMQEQQSVVKQKVASKLFSTHVTNFQRRCRHVSGRRRRRKRRQRRQICFSKNE